jgi:hypothetical protein
VASRPAPNGDRRKEEKVEEDLLRRDGVFIFLYGDGRRTLANVLVQTVKTVNGK